MAPKMKISVPLKLEVTAMVRLETVASTNSLAPGCCSRLTSGRLTPGASSATGTGALRFCASALVDAGRQQPDRQHGEEDEDAAAAPKLGHQIAPVPLME